ncbi:MAG: MATE family efflux transporter [Brotaphodocola sp.]
MGHSLEEQEKDEKGIRRKFFSSKHSGSLLDSGQSIPETILRLSVPAILEQFLICIATLTDTAMVGSIGAVATASVAINISTVWLINGFITALSVGFSYLVSHSIGEGNPLRTEGDVRQSITASLLLGAFLTVLVLSVHRFLPIWLGAAEDVVPNAQIYLGIIGLGLIPQTLGVVLSSVLRSAGNTVIPLWANLGSNVLNVIGNFFLIYPARKLVLSFGTMGTGKSLTLSIWGADFGIKGAAISTAFSQYILAFILLLVIFRVDTAVRIQPKGDYRLPKRTAAKLIRISVPVMLERTTLSLGQIALTAMISGLGTIPLAAHYLTHQTEGLLYLPAYGFSYCATTLIGQSLGAGRPKLASRFCRDICLISAAVILAACVPVFFLSGAILSLFTSESQVIVLGTVTLRIAAATELFFSFFVVAGGICRGAGDVKFPLYVSIIGMWGLRIGLVWMAANVLKVGVIGVWLAMGIDNLMRAGLCLYRLCSGKWIKMNKEHV